MVAWDIRGDCSLVCEGYLNSGGGQLSSLGTRELGDILFPYPPAWSGLSEQPSALGGDWSCLHQTLLPVPCRGFFTRAGLIVSHHLGHLPQRTSTGALHAPSLLIKDRALHRALQSISFSSGGNRTRYFFVFFF